MEFWDEKYAFKNVVLWYKWWIWSHPNQLDYPISFVSLTCKVKHCISTGFFSPKLILDLWLNCVTNLIALNINAKTWKMPSECILVSFASSCHIVEQKHKKHLHPASLPLSLPSWQYISGRQLQASKTFSLDHKVPIISSLTHTSFSFSCLCLLAQFSNLAAAAGDNFWVRNVKWAVVVVANRLLFWKPCWWIYCLENVWTLAKKSGKSTCLFCVPRQLLLQKGVSV